MNSGPDGNNLTPLRLGLALLVLFSHGYVLTGQPEDEPVARLLSHAVDGGGLAVGAFFVISGFLIARSAQVHSVGGFLVARVRRIYPAFLVCVLLQTLVLGAVFTRLPIGAYFGDRAPWLALARALVFSVPPGLPGVFPSNPVPGVVNGSLWTLRIEALCYGGLLVLSLTGWLRRGWVLVPLAGAWGLLCVTMGARAGWLPAGWLPAGWAGLPIVPIVDCVLYFMTGAAAWVYADLVPRRAVWAVAGVGGLALALPTVAAPLALHVVVPYLVLWVGLGRAVWPRMPDVSYGTYLYAFPVQQALVAGLRLEGPIHLAAAAVGPVLVLAGLSYWLIEAPLLRRRFPALSRHLP